MPHFAVETEERLLVARTSYNDIPTACPNSHAPDLAINENETKDWLIWDAPHCGLHPTLIQLFVPTLTCLVCEHKVKIEPPWLDYTPLKFDATAASRRPSRTARLIDYFLERVTGFATFDQIGLETCQSPVTIRDIFLDRFADVKDCCASHLHRRLARLCAEKAIILSSETPTGGCPVMHDEAGVKFSSYELSTTRLGIIRIDVAKLEKFGDVFMIH